MLGALAVRPALDQTIIPVVVGRGGGFGDQWHMHHGGNHDRIGGPPGAEHLFVFREHTSEAATVAAGSGFGAVVGQLRAVVAVQRAGPARFGPVAAQPVERR